MNISIDAAGVSAVADSVTCLIAGYAAWYASKEYRLNHAQQKRELAWKFLARLREEPHLRMCTVFLDWEKRKVEIPEAYREFTAPEKTFDHSLDAMRKALNPPGASSPDGKIQCLGFSWQEVHYRDCFDQLFDYFTEIHSSLMAKWLDAADLRPLQYWIEKLLLDHRGTIEQFCRSFYPHVMVALEEIAAQLNPKWTPVLGLGREDWERGRPARSVPKQVTVANSGHLN